METVFILSTSILPCLVYLSMGLYLVYRYRRGKDAANGTTLQIRKDYMIFLMVQALCFLSGCFILLCSDGPEMSVLMERTVMKVYLVSSVLPCILLHRCVYSEKPWIRFYVSVFLVSVFILLTDIMLYAGWSEPSHDVICKGAVAVNLLVFLHVSRHAVICAFKECDSGRRIIVKELLVHLVFLAVYNYLFLMYSFGMHYTADYFFTVTGFAVIHASVAAAASRGTTLVSFLHLMPDIPPGQEDTDGRPMPDTVLSCMNAGNGPKDGIGSPLSLRERLLDYFESEKPYLSKNLTMEEVAMRLYTNKSYLSKTINVEMNKNFRELVNYYRVKEAITIFSSDTDMSMTDLREKCGFNNNASFTSAFKLNTGFTPGEWCRDMKDRREKAMNKQ